MVDFDERMRTEVYQELNGIKSYYTDLCETFSPKNAIGFGIDENEDGQKVERTVTRPCRRSPLLIDFVYDRILDAYSVEGFVSDDHLVARIQQGNTEQMLFRNNLDWIRLSEVLGTIKPDKFYQNESTGQNNIQEARAALFDIYLTMVVDTDEFEESLLELV